MAPLQITVYPKGTMTPAPPSGQGGGDPYAAYDDAPPAPPQQQATDPYAAYDDAAPPKRALREIGAPESFGIGAREGVTFGGFPALHGLISAGQTKEEREASEKKYASGEIPSAASELGDLFKGLFKVGHEHLIEPALGEASKTYREERDRAREEQESAEAQNPKSYIGGQLASAVAVPLGGGARAATMAGRIGQGAKAGALGGAAYGTGSAISEGQEPLDVAKSGLLGAGTGAVFGGAGSGALETGAKIAGRVGRIGRGIRNPEDEAARQVANAVRADVNRAGPGIDPEAAAAAKRAGMPLAIADVGGQRTHDLARTAANHSPEAYAALETFSRERAAEQHPRIVGAINRMFNYSLDSGADKIALQQMAKKANRGNYAKAYAAGDRPIWSPELERLASSDAVGAAIKGAVTRGKDRAVAEGFGGFRPNVKITPDGRVEFPKGPKGAPTYPDLRFWDYTQRELSDAANAADRAGRREEAGAIKGILHDLKAELDKQVPEFAAARRGAATFFKAEEAGEAGKNFVAMNADPREVRRALSKFSAPERELFARGFADELSQAVMRRGDQFSVINKAFIDSHLAREKIDLALGPQRAKEIEALLRAEAVSQRVKNILGNSSTARQLKNLGVSAAHGGVGAGAVLGLETLRETDYSPASIITGAILLGGLRHGAHHVDAKVARKIGEMLASNDTAVLRRASQTVARSPQLLDAFRKGTEAGTRVAAYDIGPTGLGAAGAMLLEHVLAEGEPHGGHHPDDQYGAAGAVQQ